MIQNFFDFMNERHMIYLRRLRGQEWPWTEDLILQTYKFTNVFREHDATTVWYREHVREMYDNSSEVMLATVMFRWFNLISVGEALYDTDMYCAWDPKWCYEVLKNEPQWVTGAYIIKTPNGMNKLAGVCWCIDQMSIHENKIVKELQDAETLEEMWNIFLPYPYMGPFMAYEVVTDLRHTYLGRDAKDILTWANPGPGARRGLNRIHGRDLNKTIKYNQCVSEMRELLEASPEYVHGQMPDLEMREIEHTLCEFDKYERVRNLEGRPRSRYRRNKK